jgi:WD40 repeat protein
VFVSYATEDVAMAAMVRSWLVADGHDTFLAQDLRDGIAVGVEWEPRLYERLRWADAVVCVVTSDYLRSVWCTAEVAVARSWGSRLLPLVVQPDVNHPLLWSVNHADYARDPGAARAALGEALRRIEAAGGLGWPDDRSPFPGLRFFDTDLHRAFFGRRTAITELAGLLRAPAATTERGPLVVVGPSGCGKSSLVRAGLLPVLAADPDWEALAPFDPGQDPSAALARELAAAAHRAGLGWGPAQVRERLTSEDGLLLLAEELLMAAPSRRARRHLLIVVDQLEELLTQATRAGRAGFAQLLRPALAGPVRLVATLRAESLTELMDCEELLGLPIRTFALRALRPEALPAVIEGPARLAGFELDPELVNRLVADTRTGDALPLLAFTLSELACDLRRGGRLSMRRYEELGGVNGALNRQADEALSAAGAASGRARDQVIAGLLELVTVDERGNPTRRRVDRDGLPEPVRTELEAFVASRLVITERDERGAVLIGVAHEAFLSAWPPLAEAIARHTSALRARRAVENAAVEWEGRGRRRGQLWEGNQLAAAVADTGAHLRWAGRTGGQSTVRRVLGGRVLRTDQVELSPRARDFLHGSIRRDRRRRRLATTILSVLLVVALAGAGVAVVQQRIAVQQARAATAGELSAEADTLRDSQPRIALMLSVEALRLAPSGEARASLLATLTQTHYAGSLLGGDIVSTVAFSPDGRTLASGSFDHTAMLWDVSGRGRPTRLATLRGHSESVEAVAFSPDGRTLATGGGDNKAILWDVGDRAHPARLATLGDHTGVVWAVAFSPDGRTLATGSWDGSTILWDVGDRAHPVRVATLSGGPTTGAVQSVLFSPDGHTLVTRTSEHTLALWDLGDPAHPARLATVAEISTLNAVAFSPDGRTLAIGVGNGATDLWDLADRAQPTRVAMFSGNISQVSSVAFSPDGRTVATGTDLGTALLWDVSDRAHPAQVDTLHGSIDPMGPLAFSPDGRTLAGGSTDGSTILWDLRDRAHPARLSTFSASDGFWNAALSPDGRTLATANVDDTATVWDVRDRAHPARLATLTGHTGDVFAVAFGPGGRTLATASLDKTVILWDLRDRSRPAQLATVAQSDSVFTVAFSPDGRTLAAGVGVGDGTTALWDVGDLAHPTRRAVLRARGFAEDHAVAFSPDGNTLAVAGSTDGSTDGRTLLWDVANRAHPVLMAALTGQTIVNALAFSPDGHTLATGGYDRTVVLWDVADRGHPVRLSTLAGHTHLLNAVAFSPDGRMLASASADHTVILWDVSARTDPVRLSTITDTDQVNAVAFGPDGHTMVTGNAAGTVVLWDPSELSSVARNAVAIACAAAGPGLSRASWDRYVRGVPYERICP